MFKLSYPLFRIWLLLTHIGLGWVKGLFDVVYGRDKVSSTIIYMFCLDKTFLTSTVSIDTNKH